MKRPHVVEDIVFEEIVIIKKKIEFVEQFIETNILNKVFNTSVFNEKIQNKITSSFNIDISNFKQKFENSMILKMTKLYNEKITDMQKYSNEMNTKFEKEYNYVSKDQLDEILKNKYDLQFTKQYNNITNIVDRFNNKYSEEIKIQKENIVEQNKKITDIVEQFNNTFITDETLQKVLYGKYTDNVLKKISKSEAFYNLSKHLSKNIDSKFEEENITEQLKTQNQKIYDIDQKLTMLISSLSNEPK